MKLKNKVAVVTGAAKGIGKSIALEFAKHGATVIVTDLDEATVSTTVNTIKEKSSNDNIIPFKLDVCELDDFNRLGEMIVKQYDSTLSVFVNNAGITEARTVFDITTEDWHKMMNTNLRSVFYGLQTAGKIMKENKTGSIVNMSSIYGREGHELTAHYSASKAGVIDLTKSFARALAPYHIRVNSIAPSVVDTDLWELGDEQLSKLKGLKRGEAKKARLQQIPLKRAAIPEDIAKTALFLASEDASFITGECIHVTGGSLMI